MIKDPALTLVGHHILCFWSGSSHTAFSARGNSQTIQITHLIPYYFSLRSNILWFMVSNALERSRLMHKQFSFLSGEGSIPAVSTVITSMVDCLGRKPYCLSYSILFFVRK